MFDPVTETVITHAIGMCEEIAGSRYRGCLVMYLLDKLRTVDTHWVGISRREADDVLGCARRWGWQTLNWLVDHRVIFRAPGRGAGGRQPHLYAINADPTTWSEVHWRHAPFQRRLLLERAELSGRRLQDEILRRANSRAAGASSGAVGVPGHRAASSTFAARSLGVGTAPHGPSQRRGLERAANQEASSVRPLTGDRSELPPAASQRAGSFDMSNAVVRAIAQHTGAAKERVYGSAGADLAELLEQYPEERLVEVIRTYAPDGWGVGLIVPHLHHGELRHYLDRPPAAVVDEETARANQRRAWREEGIPDEIFDDPAAPAELLESPDPLVQKFARFAPVAVTPPCQNGAREETA